MKPAALRAAGLFASAALCGVYARGGAAWVLGFVALVPWMRALDASPTLARTMLGAWAMSVAFAAAAFGWFGIAIGRYTGAGGAAGVAVLLLAAPLFQPQLLVFALVRHLARRWQGPALGALAGAAAWVATEWCVPKLLGDTLGHGLHPSPLLRQAADLGGAAGLTLLLLLANEGVAAALARRAEGLGAMVRPLASAALVPLVLAGYGLAAPEAVPPPLGKPLRVGLVQSNIADYERLRREHGAGAVVRQVLDTHFAMSYDAIERQHADAVLWSETVYPTTFGHPKSEAGAAFDREILETVQAAGVPFVFGTYDRDAAGEYNAAAFVTPAQGLLGFYRKTRLFPFTERVPPWLDGPALRRWLPWTGRWQPGTGARVFPLRLADGREIPVLPLICLDDMDTQLAVEGARLGAQAILTMSNDAWFADHPQGAALHMAAAAFRSIETRLPQFRVTTTGYSAIIDATGRVVAGAGTGQRVLVIGALPVPEPRPTLVVRWGDWVGGAAAVFLVSVALVAAWRAVPGRRSAKAEEAPAAVAAQAWPARVVVLPPAARAAAAALRVFARGSLLWMVATVLFGEGALAASTLAQLRAFAALFLVPEAAAGCLLLAFAATASIENGALVLARGANRLELALSDIATAQPWRVPLPAAGLSLRLASGDRWRYGLAHADPLALSSALAAAGGAVQPRPPTRADAYARACGAVRPGRLDRLPWKFVLFPLALAIPAFRLHQHIAYGGSFGEYYSFGLDAYLTTFALWWAAWVVGVALCAAVLRTAVEAGTLATVMLRPQRAAEARRWLERMARVALYLGLPAWLLLRVLAA